MLSENMYTNYKVCSTLKANEKCFRLHKYDEGNFNEIFHEHVPNHRISGDNAIEFMKALIIKHSAFDDSQILRTYLNKRDKKPSAIKLGQVIIEYPEPGVLRIYYSSGNISAWHDEVISKLVFRV